MAAGASMRAAAMTAIAPARRSCLSIRTRMGSLLWGAEFLFASVAGKRRRRGRNLDRIGEFVLWGAGRSYAFLRESEGRTDKYRSSSGNRESSLQEPRIAA